MTWCHILVGLFLQLSVTLIVYFDIVQGFRRKYCCLLGMCTEGGGIMFLKNFCTHLPNYTMSTHNTTLWISAAVKTPDCLFDYCSWTYKMYPVCIYLKLKYECFKPCNLSQSLSTTIKGEWQHSFKWWFQVQHCSIC